MIELDGTLDASWLNEKTKIKKPSCQCEKPETKQLVNETNQCKVKAKIGKLIKVLGTVFRQEKWIRFNNWQQSKLFFMDYNIFCPRKLENHMKTY